MIHGNILPSSQLVKTLKKLKDGEFISVNGNTGIIFRFSKKEIEGPNKIKVSKAITVREEIKSIQFPWHIFQLNDQAIRDRKSTRLNSSHSQISYAVFCLKKK